jgi:hypothetical protein
MIFICIAPVPNALNNNIIIFIVPRTRNSDYRRPYLFLYKFTTVLIFCNIT